MNMILRRGFIFGLMSFLICASAHAAGVIINNVELSDEEEAQLIGLVGPVVPGEYWYDSLSGLWGHKGMSYGGQILPGLRLGGELQADASGGLTQVFINGRAIHPYELQALQASYGYIQPGRYWLNAQGIGGYEGGPAQFNLMAGAGTQGGGAGYNTHAAGASLGSDGNCSYAMTGAGSVMTGNC